MKAETQAKSDLAQRKCQACEGGTAPFSEGRIEDYLKCVLDWRFEEGAITRQFQFKNYDQTLAFVNKIADMAKQEDHHPEIQFGYKRARVSYSTHSINGISENDFICAAKADRIFGEMPPR